MLSIIIPFYNEEESLPVLINQLIDTVKTVKEKWEIILVDDGSDDAYASEFRVHSDSIGTKFKVIKHRKRLGKGKALLTGFNNSKGNIIVFMDADLQNDPSDLSKFLDKINQGYDLVNGWRKNRQDNIFKTLPSSIFNLFLLKIFLRSKFHDINCGFKTMRREVLEIIPLYGDNYRFLPLMADQEGFKTTEVIIAHHPRRFGKSKYGFWHLLFGMFDTLTTYFIYKFSEKPLHFFGLVGGSLFLIGFLISLYLTVERVFLGILLYRRPLLFLGILLIIVGLQIVMTGIIGELIVHLNKKSNR